MRQRNYNKNQMLPTRDELRLALVVAILGGLLIYLGLSSSGNMVNPWTAMRVKDRAIMLQETDKTDPERTDDGDPWHYGR